MELRDEVTGFATDHRVVVGEGSDWSVYVGNVIHFPIPVEVTLVDFILTVHVVVLGVGTRVGKSMAISLFLALPEIRAVDAMPCL